MFILELRDFRLLALMTTGVGQHIRQMALGGSARYQFGGVSSPRAPLFLLIDILRAAFLSVPLYSLFLSLRNQAPLWDKELVGLLIPQTHMN